ncbi:MAG: hypothetical protein IPK53_16680 [bacterium]|nr:hypothetical protein [bacterium]
MKIPDDPFGIKVAVGGVVELAKARWLPVLAATGEARAELVRARGEFEVRRLENQLRVIEQAEEILLKTGEMPNPLSQDLLFAVLDEAGRTSSEVLQRHWAELLARCAGGKSSEERIFTCHSILRQMSAKDAQFLSLLVGMVPVQKAKVRVLYYACDLTVGTITIQTGNISCLYQENTTSEDDFSDDLSTKLWLSGIEELENFRFFLRNIERIGLTIHVSRDDFWDTETFTFSIIGEEFLKNVGIASRDLINFPDFAIRSLRT